MTIRMRAAIYLRISRDDGTSTSVERQREDCVRYAEQRGWDITEVLQDVSKSAFRPGIKRPGYARMQEVVARREVDVILAHALDRIDRRAISALTFLEQAKSNGVMVLLVREGVDTSTTSGEDSTLMSSMVAELESRNTSKRIVNMLDRRRRMGLHHGIRPYGLATDSIKLEPAEAAVIRECAQRLLAGDSLWSIAKHLREQQTPSPSGTPWTSLTIRRILMRPSVAGLMAHKGEIIGPAAWAAVLDPDVWDQVRAILNDPARKEKAWRNDYDYVLGGLLRCGLCGCRMAGNMQQNKLRSGATANFRRYVCHLAGGGCARMSVGADRIEQFVCGSVLLMLPTLIEMPNTTGVVAKETVTSLDNRLAGLAGRLAVGDITEMEWAAARLAVMAKKEDLARLRVAAVRARTTVTPNERWESIPVSRRRELVRTMVSSVEIHPAAAPGPFFPVEDRAVINWTM